MDWGLIISRLMHDFGIALGVGGATIAFLISKKAEKKPEISQATGFLMESISKLIWVGLLLLIVSGIGLTAFIKWPVNIPLLIVKHAIVLIIVINGIYLGVNSKKLGKAIKEKNVLGINKLKLRLKKVGLLNLICWYIVMILSVLL